MKLFSKCCGALALLLSPLFIGAQVADTVSIGAGYINQAYYNIATGDKTSVSATNWDLQIALSLFSVSIRTNDGHDVELYAPANQDTGTWSALDTTGMSLLYNSDQDWEDGSFTSQATGHPDYGWGTYVGSGNLQGAKLFVIKLHDGTWKKIWIVYLAFGDTYTIRTANLDNSNDQTLTVTKTDYTGKSFVYVDLASNSILDIEPADWDLMFRRYISELAPNVYYPVTGVQSNFNTGVIEVADVDVTSNDYTGFTFDSSLTVIGNDWKSFNTQTFMWEIQDSLAYFVLDASGVVTKLVFTDFGGNADGNYIFEVTQLSTSVDELENKSFTMFPNPATDQLFVRHDSKGGAVVRLLDTNGRVLVEEIASEPNTMLNVSTLAPGIYMLSVEGDNAWTTQPVIIN